MVEQNADWMAVDWRADGLTVWVMGADGSVKDRLTGDQGDRGLSPGGLEMALGAVIAGHLDDDSETGIWIAGNPARPSFWSEQVVARKVPATPLADDSLTSVGLRDGRMRVRLVSGLIQSGPPALMLTDTLRVAGFLAKNDGFDGVICLPGDKSHWVHVSAGEVVSFQTVMTQDLVRAALHAVGVEPGATTLGDIGIASMEDAMSHPERIGQKIGSISAQVAVNAVTEAETREGILGAFLGLELASMRPYWLGQQVALIAGDDDRAAYEAAMKAQAIMLLSGDEEETLLDGFRAARAG